MLSTSVEVYLFKARSAVDKRPPRSRPGELHTIQKIKFASKFFSVAKEISRPLPRNGARRLLRLNDASSSTLEG